MHAGKHDCRSVQRLCEILQDKWIKRKEKEEDRITSLTAEAPLLPPHRVLTIPGDGAQTQEYKRACSHIILRYRLAVLWKVPPFTVYTCKEKDQGDNNT